VNKGATQRPSDYTKNKTKKNYIHELRFVLEMCISI
jgi:hypothetical protein